MLKVAFLWHMHQPYYRDPATGQMILPWVRLHSLKDYYDLPARVGKFDRLRMTFNLVPSLLEQIDLYLDGKTSDRQLELTRKPAGDLSRKEKGEIFRTFFSVNPDTMISPYPRYRRLYKKLFDCGQDADLAARTASLQEIRDLTVWANLVWIDPLFRRETVFRNLFEKGEKFSEEDKQALLDAQMKIMGGIIPIYKSLMDDNRIEVSFTPYFHPILPLICDTDSAREALPGINLPKHRFCYPEDADRQVALAVEMYREKFGREPVGMWPSEGSISQAMAPILVRHGIQWMASDEQVLYTSSVKSGKASDDVTPHAVYNFETESGPIKILFRDHALSDRIGFVYSSWDEEKAVNDFLGHLHRLADLLASRADDAVVPIILDGENCWEYYRNDGHEFLELFFERLNQDELIQTVTLGEACSSCNPRPLKNITAGSWINHNFRIWIGHAEDNIAWDLLWEARRDLMKFKKEHPDFDPARLAAAEKSLLVAEGSDWNWWYGDEHRGAQNEIFDQIYRGHLISIYTNLNLEVPTRLLSPITDRMPETFVTEPEGIITPTIDGRLTHYYEWLGAGTFDCLKAGGAMHRAEPAVSHIYYVSDDENIYIRVDFIRKGFLIDKPENRLKILIQSPGQGEFVFSVQGLEKMPDWAGDEKDVLCGINEIAEIGLKKKIFVPNGKGEIYFRVGLFDDKKELESWPTGDPICFRFAGEGEEIVWDL